MSSAFELQGRTAVVTGGSSGIGLATVRLMLREGAAVAFCGRDGDRLAQAEATLRDEFPQARLFAQTCDVLDAAATQAFAAASEAARGPGRRC